ncbi:hypothetical protein LPJ60_000002 [Coemansia sp. RSA 2675]|nr:hypothetical protein LPJ60_000002 [Coemansia sp. RSA 2675]
MSNICNFWRGLALFVILVCSIVASPVNDVTNRNGKPSPSPANTTVAAWITQPIDHFGANNGTWRQQYMVNDKYYKPGGPIYILTPGESEVSAMYTEDTHFVSLASETNGLMVAIEHRFFGNSNPMPDLSGANLKYLTLENTLEDFARFIRTVKTNSSSLFQKAVPANSKIVFVGGSYGGALAAWVRAMYPDLVTAAWASSAPVFTYIDFYHLDQALGRHLTARGCGELFARGVKELDAILLSNNSSGLDSVRKMFSVTGSTAQDVAVGITSAITGTVNLPVMLNGDALDQSVCSFFENSVPPLTAYSKAVSAAVKGYAMPQAIRPYRNMAVYRRDMAAKSQGDLSLNQPFRSWYYICCKWFSDWQVAPPKDSNITAYRSQLVDREYWQGGCQSSFGSSVHPLTDATEHNRRWLGMLKDVANIYYTVGELDPWRDTTVATVDGTLLSNTASSPIFVMNGATHTQDMQPDTAYDLNSVRMAKQMGDSLIKKWIA